MVYLLCPESKQEGFSSQNMQYIVVLQLEVPAEVCNLGNIPILGEIGARDLRENTGARATVGAVVGEEIVVVVEGVAARFPLFFWL
jgi:hypothetical protein